MSRDLAASLRDALTAGPQNISAGNAIIVSAPVGDAREAQRRLRQHALHEEAAGRQLGVHDTRPSPARAPSCPCAALAIRAHM